MSALAAVASPLFSPQYQTPQQAQHAVLDLVHRAPETFGLEGTRWSLASIRAAVPWMADFSLSGVWRMLGRLKVVGKRGRDYLHSPDPDYEAKLAEVEATLARVARSEGKEVFVFGDELTFYRQPSLARDYEQAGRQHQPLARRSYRPDTTGREAAVVNALTGQVVHLQASRISLPREVALLVAVREAFADAERIYLAQDNWPVHFHPDVLAALEPQQTRFPLPVPKNWPTEPSAKAKRLGLPIQILPLPTYAPWTNPIEKLWRWLKNEYLHLHRSAEDWAQLKLGVSTFLDQFAAPSPELLRYIGLTPNSKLYGSAVALAVVPP